MKRIIYIAYLSLLALILISCEQENVAPNGALAATTPDAARTSCQSYNYLTKTGVFQFGNVRTDYILVGFADNVTPAQQQALLSQYTIFDQIDGEFFTDSGIVTIVKLTGNATCSQVEQMLSDLEKKNEVNFATPTFNDPNGVFSWIGQTNEFIVTLKNAKQYRQLEQLARITRTTIVTSITDEIYILSADKNSVGDALQMSSLFNLSPFVASAEPNFLLQAPPLRSGAKAEYKSSKILMPAQAVQ